MKKIPITIAIPALNEELNIKKLVVSLLNQNAKNYILKDLVVISDGSDDNTVSIVKNIGGVVRVVDYKERKGKSSRLNDIFRNVVNWDESEIVVLFDADTIPVDTSVVENLLWPFINNKNIKLTSGKPMPVESKTFFEKILKVSAFVQNYIKKQMPLSVFTCHGRSLAIHKKLARIITVPNYMVGNDAFIYLTNKKYKFGYKYITDANVYYRMPASFKDFKKQFVRFRNSQKMLQEYFGNWIKREYIVPKKIKLKAIFWSFVHYPFLAPIYYLSYIFASKSNKKDTFTQDGKWDVSDSTKKL